MAALDVRGSLAMLAEAFKQLEQENERLRQECERFRQDLATASRPVVQVSPLEGKLFTDPASEARPECDRPARVESMHSLMSMQMTGTMRAAFPTDDVSPIDEGRNMQRARLQSIIAEFDPEENGGWAVDVLNLGTCQEALRERGPDHPTVDDASLQNILEKLEEHCQSLEPPVSVTRMQLLNLTSVADITHTFGEALLEDVMSLQDAFVEQITTALCMRRRSLVQMDEVTPSVFVTSPWMWLPWLVLQEKVTIVEIAGTILLLLNTIFLGISADGDKTWVVWDYISASFALAFFLELCARICLSGGLRAFYCGESRRWNAFDTAIVAIMLLDVVTLIVPSTDELSTRTLTVVRIVRLLRLTRIARLAKTGVFHELTYMIRGIEAGTSTLVWAFIILMCLSYIGAVFLTMTIGMDANDPVFIAYGDAHFGTVSRSMFTLFRCFTGDCNAFDGRPLSYALLDRYGNLTIAIYWATVMLVTFGLFNVMVANFIQNSQRAARFNDVERQRILKRERKMVHDKTQELLTYISDSVSKTQYHGEKVHLSDLNITRELWQVLLSSPDVKQWLDDMGCDDSLRNKLFDKIDNDGNGVVTCSELVTGIIDLLRGRFDNFEALKPLLKSVNNRLLKLEGMIAARSPDCQLGPWKSEWA